MCGANRIKARMTINHEQKINSEKVNEHRILFTQFGQYKHTIFNVYVPLTQECE
jgi:hypothetical protein